MIAVARRLFVIALLLGLMVLATQIGTPGNLLYPRTLAVLGFMILVSFTLGELFTLIRLPKVLGYLAAGALFGIPLSGVLQSFDLNLISTRVINNLEPVNNIALAVIALAAGLHLKLNHVKWILKPALLMLLVKVVVIFVLVTAGVYFLMPAITGTQPSAEILIAIGLLVSVISMGTSIELTMAVADDLESDNGLVDLTLGTAVLKDIVNILLLAVVIYFVNSNLFPSSAAGAGGDLTQLLAELGKTIIAGLLIGGLVVFYLKYIRSEITFFLVCLVVFGSYASILLHLETLLLFVVAGAITVNFSDTEELERSVSNFSLPVYIVFFALAGASLEIDTISRALPLAAALFLVRVVAIVVSLRLTGRMLTFDQSILKYGWTGFISTGVLMLGFLQIISKEVPAVAELVTPILYDLILLNLIAGPVIFRVALVKFGKSIASVDAVEEPKVETPKEVEKLAKVVKEYRVVFSEPIFEDKKLNNILFDVYFKIIGLVNNFRDKFIAKRNNESQELLEETVALYRNMFLSIESIIMSGKEPRAIKATLQNLRINQTEALLHHLEERKQAERKLANYDTLARELLNELVKVTDDIPDIFSIAVLTNLASFRGRSIDFKLYLLRLKASSLVSGWFRGGDPVTVDVELKNMAKFYLNAVTTTEILETMNLVGADRLNLYRKLKAIHKNFISYLDEMITIIGQEKSSLGFVTVFFMRYEELKEMFFNELDVYINEQTSNVDQIEKRLTYAFASPYNSFVKHLGEIIRVEKRGNEFDLFKAMEDSQKKKGELIDSLRFWVVYYHGIIGLIQKELYIYRFEIQLNNFLDRALLNIADEISSRIRSGCPKIADQIRHFTHNLTERLPEGYDGLKSYSDNFRISQSLSELTLVVRELERASRSRKLRTFLDTVINGINSLSAALPAESEYLEESDLNLPERTPGFIELKNYKIGKITQNFLLSRFPREIGDVNEFLVNYVETSLKEFRNLESSVIYYIDSIVKRLEEDPGDLDGARDIISALSENFITRLREIENNNDKLELSINSQVAVKTASAIQEVKTLITGSNREAQKAMRTAGKFSRLLTVAFKFMRVNTHYFFHRIALGGNFILNRFILPLYRRLSERFRIFSGKLPDSYKEDLFKTKEILDRLPFIYRRLFDGTSLESSEFFKGEQDLRSLIEKAQTRFRSHLPSSILITGAPGSGKTSYINFIKKEVFRPGDYLEFHFVERISTVDELRSLLSQAMGYNELKSIDSIILDLNERFRNKFVLLVNIHKIFLRTVDGFGALHAMLHIISMTNSNIIWIATAQSIAWHFIRRNFRAAPLFEFRMALEDLNRDRMKDIILKRQETAGFTFKFAKDDLYLLRRKFFSSSKMVEEQTYLSRIYFDRLTEYSGGNIVAGMNYWLNSIVKIEENTLTIRTYQPYPYIDLSILDLKTMTALHAVILHGGLKRSHLAESLNIPEKEAGEILNKLYSMGILRIGELTKSHDYYYTNKFKFKSIERELIRRNLLPGEAED